MSAPAEEWALAQTMPGPNVVNLSLVIGNRYFGLRGACAALLGMLSLKLGRSIKWDGAKQTITAPKILIATGSAPMPRPANSPMRCPRPQVSRLSMTRWPVMNGCSMRGRLSAEDVSARRRSRAASRSAP